MDDERWYLANIIFFWVLLLEKFQDAGMMDINRCVFLETTTVFHNEINLISEWFAMTGFSVSCRELLLCSTSFGNGVEIVRGGDALLLGSVRILEQRGGHWSSSMKSVSAKSSRTLNPLSCDCGRHIGCGWPFFF